MIRAQSAVLCFEGYEIVVEGFLILLACQLLGELIVVVADVPIPGSVVGMVLLLLLLVVLQEVPAGLRLAGEGLLKVLPLLLVPAGVGLMRYFNVLSETWYQLLIALFVSTFITMVVVGLLLKLGGKSEPEVGDD